MGCWVHAVAGDTRLRLPAAACACAGASPQQRPPRVVERVRIEDAGAYTAHDESRGELESSTPVNVVALQCPRRAGLAVQQRRLEL